ncbi:hypothetical protein [[Acholeplasma] multilocale]|uniref:hypothetical protein n=1 Tax=[Acholeplasma] multilocale TaxID=264638 RepID=UPI0004044116|nr:hypothetical protein [[Acholeplasma] multilocale]
MNIETKLRTFANLDNKSSASVISKQLLKEIFVIGKISNITELAEELGIGQGTVSKFVKKIGFENYKQMTSELNELISKYHISSEEVCSSIEKVVANTNNIFNNFHTQYAENIIKAAEKLKKAEGQIFIFGDQTHDQAVEMLYSTVANVKERVYKGNGAFIFEILISKITSQDLVVFNFVNKEHKEFVKLIERVGLVTDDIIVISDANSEFAIEPNIRISLDFENDRNLANILNQYVAYEISKCLL